MELFEQLRREYEFGIGTVPGVSQKYGANRRQVPRAAHSNRVRSPTPIHTDHPFAPSSCENGQHE